MNNNNWIQTLLVVSGLLVSSATAGNMQDTSTQPLSVAAVSSDWIVKSENSICGVSEARQVSNPAKVDYDALMKATPEMQELRKKRIDKKSARGQTLVSAARDRVRTAACSVMKDKGHCSVWKAISNKKGKRVPDITATVKGLL